jgi:hypothetical protein
MVSLFGAGFLQLYFGGGLVAPDPDKLPPAPDFTPR